MKKIASIFMFLLVMSFAAGAQAYNVTVYTNYVSWLNAINLSTLVVENFDDATLEPGLSITETGYTGAIHYGVYENIVDQDVPSYQVFNLSQGMTAWGGWFDLKNPGGAGTGIDMYIDDNNTFVTSIANTNEGQFVGFVADGSFNGVRLQDAGGSGIQETYFLVDSAMSAVPIPPAIFLLGSGLLGLGFVRRRTNK
ncbi:VPLPA-CTERM protein sorting domain-containing protein [Syntrophus gentianae]|uniref:VPLPA-CTERM protein sorting domain-containing protein n=1 Tax=Syntrophus gentianae TaxID=43775 RepID=A0A1H7ZG48_9BACT|nr:hypothetical protein [Syntrophus gentianae]SEM57255.1 VPLPA-CTERM protein sorting domain-containing protein [Syntrophus gentianae]